MIVLSTVQICEETQFPLGQGSNKPQTAVFFHAVEMWDVTEQAIRSKGAKVWLVWVSFSSYLESEKNRMNKRKPKNLLQ